MIRTLLLSSAVALAASPAGAATAFAVTLDPAIHGSYQIKPSLPADGQVPAGTVITVTAKPDPGYTFDAGY